MDPVKEPMCAVCGATQADAALVGRPEAGWVCADSVPCIERSNHRAWVPARPWELSDDPLHPTGRCTCGGEGRCEWCQKICQTCGGDGVGEEAWLACGDCLGTGWRPDGDRRALELQLLDICENGQHSFSWRMGLEPCRYCGLPTGGEDPEDYEALGYPETEVRTTPHSFGTIAAQVRSWWR